MLTLKHLKTLRHVSILIDHHQGVRRCLVKVTEFQKITEFKILEVHYLVCNIQWIKMHGETIKKILSTVHKYRISKEYIDVEGGEIGCIWNTAPVFALMTC